MATSSADPPPHPPPVEHRVTTSAPTVFRPCGSMWSECGYCKGQRASIVSRPIDASSRAYTMMADNLSLTLYQDLLMECGWRRSGRAIYKPNNFVSCCPALTIRLPVHNFVPTKQQRKLVQQVQRLLRKDDNDEMDQDQHNDQKKTTTKSIKQSSNAVNKSVSVPLAEYEQVLHQTGFLSHLQQLTYEVLVEQPQQQPPPQSQSENGGIRLQSFHSFEHDLLPQQPSEIRYKVTKVVPTTATTASKPPQDDAAPASSSSIPTKDDAATTNNTTTSPTRRVVVLSTSICASIVGRAQAHRARPLLKTTNPSIEQQSTATTQAAAPAAAAPALSLPPTLDRGELATRLSHALSQRLLQQKSHNYTNGTTTKGHFRVGVTSIEAHVPSGQVLVHVSLEEWDGGNSGGNGGGAVTSSSTVIPAAAVTNESHSHHHSNKLQKWLYKQQKQLHQSTTTTTPNGEIVVGTSGGPYEITITTIPAYESALDPTVHQLYVRYQHDVHGDANPFEEEEEEGTSSSTMTTNAIDRNVLDKRQHYSSDHNPDIDWKWLERIADHEWQQRAKDMLFNTYRSFPLAQQSKIVQSYSHFYDFLVDNPFPSVAATNASQSTSAPTTTSTSTLPPPPPPPGAYHQHYKIHNILVAVGVIDILPKGLSSVYLFYEPSFAQRVFPLGKYAILKEIQYTSDTLHVPYYYLGYYIESCGKMKYKAEYHPSQLLCPITYQWVDAAQAIAILLRTSPQRHCCRLAPIDASTTTTTATVGVDGDVAVAEDPTTSGDADDDDAVDDELLNQIQLDVGIGHSITLNMLNAQGQQILKPILHEFVTQMGTTTTSRHTIVSQCTLGFR